MNDSHDAAGAKPVRSRAIDIDRHVGARIRERRVSLGLTQTQMSELIGVTYQQAHKYEKGTNRISAGRLYRVAQALGVEIGYFFEGASGTGESELKTTRQQRLMLELGKKFLAIKSRRHQDAVCALARALTDDAGTS